MTKKIISLEVSDELKEALRIEAFNKAVTVSALIRQILETNLKVSPTKPKAKSAPERKA